ncbi:7410_t:CDS:2 [Acaulospora morrowiae]|uniref:7410_t:CDS:1 n=1 Tax=Acaulospora morrowiae TaxID=94023 RepID=A0A9N9F4V3_9GLOM|nr:7410_t:CDS:2 [Acaulospora morrowiae]
MEKSGVNLNNTNTPSASNASTATAVSFPQPAPRSPPGSSTPTENYGVTHSYDFLYELVQKRVSTFTYLKKVHEGKIHWFNTVCLNKEDLGMVYENSRMKKRTGNFFILGASLAPILDINNPQDYVKALNVMLQEFEYHTNEHSKQKMKNFFRKSKIVKDDDASFQESGEYTYLFVPNIPFDLDYFQTFYTLCDILVEVYNKLLVGTTSTITTSFTESVQKVDGKFKKIIALIAKEIDTLSRNTIKDELRVIDPIIIMSPSNAISSRRIHSPVNFPITNNSNDGIWDSN